ncbi:MAG: peptidase S10 [Gammaproteobacteria bacterium]|nr:peptidase S10 [Gammaproteobacteria bacterium]
MKQVVALTAAFSLTTAMALAAPQKAAQDKSPAESGPAPAGDFTPRAVKSTGTVTVEGHKIAYDAVAGTIIVHPKGWDDAAKPQGPKDATGTADGPPVASMFYIAYFKQGVDARTRPVTFLYNGGPGSSTIWLHMGAFGPVRIVTRNDSHTPPAPYHTVDNAYSLLDASDLVFIDAPGTGFSRIEGKGKEQAFWGVDQDGNAFASFITQFLSKYQRWNSPKYLFGESYGTPRSAVLINDLETDDDIDFNGVILLSQVLNFDLMADRPQGNPSVDLGYEIALPTFAATAWYHHMVASKPDDLESFLKEVEQFAMGDYADALQQGANLPEDQFNAIAEKLHGYTGLPVAYIKKANLRISGAQFEQELQNDAGLTTGRLDSRFSGPTMDPLGEDAEYDPQSAAISSAYVSSFNDYARRSLHYVTDQVYNPEIPLWFKWEFKHQPPGARFPMMGAVNVMPDLATAMKYDPNLKISLNGGYFDLATPFFQGMYEMHHLQIPQKLQSNIEYHYYQSGHMVYANETSLKQLHDNVAAFIRKTDNQAGE